jgi:phage antirepressor YoqD-like protein
MNVLTNAAPTMSSYEIAMLLRQSEDEELRHDNVKRTIERLALRGVMTLPPLEEVSNPGPGPKTIKVYRVGKRDSYVVVAQLSPEFTARLVDRWQELEAAIAAPRVPQTYAEALRLAADQAEELIQKAMQLEAQKPAVEFVERYVAAEGNKGVRQVAQLLNVPNEREFIQWLIDAGFMYRLEGNLTPMANQRHTGRFVIKAGVSRTSDHAYNAAKFTPKGVEWIAGEWAKHQVRQPELI